MWASARLADIVVRLDAGVSVNSEDRPIGIGEVGVLKTSAMCDGRFDPSEHKAVLGREVRRVATPVEGDSILVSRMNTPDLVGECAYVAESHPDLFLPDRVWQLCFRDREAISVRWLSFVLSSCDAKAFVKLNATGTSGSMKNLPKARLLSMPLSLPPLPEQRRIAEILDTLDEAIRKTEEVIAKLQQMKQGLLHDLLTRGIDQHGELRDPERHPEQFKDSSLGRIPRGWKVRRVGDVFESQLGKMLSKEAASGPSQAKYLTNRHVQWGRILTDDLDTMSFSETERAKFSLKPGDLLICEGGEVGRTAIWHGSDEPVFYQKALHRLRPLEGAVLPGFMARYMRVAAARGLFADLSSQTSIAHLTQEKLALLKMPVPPISEQQVVIAAWDSLDKQAASEEQQLDKLRTLKHGLMDDLLTGRVRVTSTTEAVP